MKISCSKLGIHFNYKYLFKQVSLEFELGKAYGLLGPNGTGKSTLLKILSGFMEATDGSIEYNDEGTVINPTDYYKYISYVAPYMDLFEELTLIELLELHFKLKPLKPDYSIEKIIKILGFEGKEGRELRFFSSGMKQKLKLALGLYTDTPILILDEPCTNMDSNAKLWYQMELNTIINKRLILIATNDLEDIEQCTVKIDLKKLGFLPF